MSKFTNIYFQNNNEKVFSYRSNKLVFEETFLNGMLVSSGYNTAGFPLNVLTNFNSRINYRKFAHPTSFCLEINGCDASREFSYVSFNETVSENETKTAIIKLKSNIYDLELEIFTVLDGTNVLTRYYKIKNCSEFPLSINKFSLLSGAIENFGKHNITNIRKPEELYEVGYFDSDNWGREGDFNWHPLKADGQYFDTKFGRDRFRHPLMFVKNKITGTMFYTQVAWTGAIRFGLDLNSTFENDDVTLSADIELIGYKPIYVLKPNECFISPEIHFGMITGSLDDAVNDMNEHLRKSVFTMPGTFGHDLLIGAGMGPEHDMSVETTKSFMKQMKEMGGEVFIIDAGWQSAPHNECGWYVDNGKNIPNSERYPNGIKELRDFAHSIGLKFGMWMEPERLGSSSECYQKHPEWFAISYHGDKQWGSIDLSIKEAKEWVLEEISKVVTDNQLDLLRIDCAVGPGYFCMRDVNNTGIKECENIRIIKAIYEIYQELKTRFPNVIFENCASGGGRTDIGMMKFFNHTWVSDWQRLPRSVNITSGMTIALPPEKVDRLFAGMGSHEIGSLELNLRNTMLGHMTLNVINPMEAEINSDSMEFIKHSTEIYKNFIREFLPTSKIYHHTPENNKSFEDGYSALEVASADRTKSVVLVASLTNPKDNIHFVFPKGINRSSIYKVTLDNSGDMFEMTGNEIQNQGIRVELNSALSSELILIEAKL